MIYDDHSVILGDGEAKEMGEYNCSIPTGQTIGKRWLRDQNVHAPDHLKRTLGPDLWMGEYVPCDKPGMIGIKWREVLEIVPNVAEVA